MGFKVSLGPCLEARVFGNWEGEKGMSEALGGGRGIDPASCVLWLRKKKKREKEIYK